METAPTPDRSLPPGPGHQVPATSGQLGWLREQVDDWQAEGLLDAPTAAAVLGRYRESRRFAAGRVMLGLGAAFLGVGTLWLVAANLDELPPLARILIVVALWLAALTGAEALAARKASRPVVGAVRLLAAFGIGAVVFQAAQSLQVPAYEPALLGLWGLGALLQAYALGGRGPLVVGLAATTGWGLWQGLADGAESQEQAVHVLLLMALLGAAVAALHERAGSPFGEPWRHAAAALSLVGLFTAGVPGYGASDLVWGWWPLLLVASAALATLAALATAGGLARHEVLGSVAALVAGATLVLWRIGTPSSVVGLEELGHAVLAVLAYAAVAIGLAVVGTLRDSWPLTAMAAVGLVCFTAFQSFAVFATILDGAWLFVLLGLVLLGTGLGFDRARRGLAAAMDGSEGPDGGAPIPGTGVQG